MTKPANCLAASASELGRAIAAGEIDPRELVDAFLDAIDSHPDASRIYARSTPDRARQEAGEAAGRVRAGRRLGPLDGVPISWKDLFDTAGAATESGSLLLKGRIPEADAVVLNNASAHGLVCLGKTHQSELAFSGLGYNPVTATPPCTYGPDVVPGGSSSGAAASVAFGLAAAAIGSDTGGSVRIPAAWNDLVGLKTTHGRISLDGVVPLCRSFDTVGPLTRTVEDAAMLLAILEGKPPGALRSAPLEGMKFLVPEHVVLDDIEDAPADAFDRSIRALERAGAVIETAPLPEYADSLDLAPHLFAAEAYSEWRSVIEDSPQLMFHQILKRFRGGKQILATDYIEGLRRLDDLRASCLTRMEGYSAVLAPTSAILPPETDRLNTDPDYFARANLLALRNTRIINLLGQCALTLPAGAPSCGLMLTGSPMAEEKLLAIGASVAMVI